jgi:hypothetical protein
MKIPLPINGDVRRAPASSVGAGYKHFSSSDKQGVKHAVRMLLP